MPNTAISATDRLLDRRSVLRLLGAAGVTAAVPTGFSSEALGAVPSAADEDAREERLESAFLIRKLAAREQLLAREFVPHPTNGDEERYESKVGSYSKGLPHDDLGLVDPDAFEALVEALEGDGDYADIPLGGTRRLVNPEAASSFNTTGLDPHDVFIEAPPAFASEQTAAETVELYWQALLRDVPFSEYDDSCLAEAAAAELSDLDDFRGPKQDGCVTTDTLFRGNVDGALEGPYVSQFFYKDIQRGAVRRDQRFRVPEPEQAFMTDFETWLDVQNGAEPTADLGLMAEERYMITGRDLARWVQRDWLPQAFVNAALVLAEAGVPYDSGNPYAESDVQSSFVDYGITDVSSGVPGIVLDTVHMGWYFKWLVHRRLRPEVYGGRVQVHKTGRADFPIDDQLLESEALERTEERFGSYLLPQAYPEGSPLHPSYPAGHAVAGGACATVLKAFFDETAEFPNPVRPTNDGQDLEELDESLTVGGELNKLVTNHTIGRNWAGIHYRSSGINGWKAGEQIALDWLEDRLSAKAQPSELTVTTFDGAEVTVEPSVDCGD